MYSRDDRELSLGRPRSSMTSSPGTGCGPSSCAAIGLAARSAASTRPRRASHPAWLVSSRRPTSACPTSCRGRRTALPSGCSCHISQAPRSSCWAKRWRSIGVDLLRRTMRRRPSWSISNRCRSSSIRAGAATDEELLFPDVGTNIALRILETTAHAIRTGRSAATVEAVNQRLAPTPIEAVGLLASPGPAGQLDIWCGHQAPARLRRQLASALGISESDIGSVSRASAVRSA